MIKTKVIVIGALFAVIAALFQIIPVLFSEVFILLTIFSAVPIYIVSRINPKAGFLSYLVAGIIIMLLSTHEGLFFLCTNGIIGISLGICCYYTNIKFVTWFISSITLTSSLSIMNYGIGIPVLGNAVPGRMIVQLAILFLISIIYNILYYYFSNFIFNLLKKVKVL